MQVLWKACPHLSIPDAFPFACMLASDALSNAPGELSDAAGVLSDAAGVLSSRQMVQIISILMLRARQRESDAATEREPSLAVSPTYPMTYAQLRA
jgi:hypothetical protein